MEKVLLTALLGRRSPGQWIEGKEEKLPVTVILQNRVFVTYIYTRLYTKIRDLHVWKEIPRIFWNHIEWLLLWEK